MTNTSFISSSNKSIAVLPFTNMSSDADNEYFSDGITEEIINALTSIQGLKVIARTSSFAFKGKNEDVRTIGKKLGVQTILEGSVRKVKNRVRITAQLIRTDDGSHLWSKNFDRELEDIFALQDEISLLIANQIRDNFGHFEMEDQLIKVPNISVDTYELFLKGKSYLNRFNVENVQFGISIMKDILKSQPNFALAHVNIHYGYNMLAAGGFMPVKESLEIGKIHLDKALEIDNNLAECYHSLGWHSLNQDWDFINASKYLLKAIELRPSYADAHQKLFITLALEGKLDEAFQHINTAIQLDPLQPLNNYFFGYYYYLTQQLEESNSYMKRTFELDPSFMVGYSIYALSLILQKKESKIFEVIKTIPDIEGADYERLYMQTLAYSSLKDLPKANEGVKKLTERLTGKSRERIRFFLIYIQTLLENYDAALDLIDEGLLYKEPLMTLLKVDPILKPLHTFDRFQKALDKIYALSDLSSIQYQQINSSIMDETEIETYLKKLEELNATQKPYLESGLTLKFLASKIDIHPNKLSWLVNERIGKNFNEYINTFRLEEFKRKAVDPKNSHLTLLGLAYDSGFNSKTVFNAFFKKMEGTTPSAWLKSIKS